MSKQSDVHYSRNCGADKVESLPCARRPCLLSAVSPLGTNPRGLSLHGTNHDLTRHQTAVATHFNQTLHSSKQHTKLFSARALISMHAPRAHTGLLPTPHTCIHTHWGTIYTHHCHPLVRCVNDNKTIKLKGCKSLVYNATNAGLTLAAASSCWHPPTHKQEQDAGCEVSCEMRLSLNWRCSTHTRHWTTITWP